LPVGARERHGLQPVIHLKVNGQERAEVAVNQPVRLEGRIEMPPRTGKIVQYDWYLGGSDFTYEPATKLAKPAMVANPTRTVSFPTAGEYLITLRTFAQRDGVHDTTNPTLLQNLARVRVVVR
ncbi:MAG: PKD domain-containing protein, partial [Novosphingobium sp.]|nr:PKD domain-containing protein [Novosphingobium sp.]